MPLSDRWPPAMKILDLPLGFSNILSNQISLVIWQCEYWALGDVCFLGLKGKLATWPFCTQALRDDHCSNWYRQTGWLCKTFDTFWHAQARWNVFFVQKWLQITKWWILYQLICSWKVHLYYKYFIFLSKKLSFSPEGWGDYDISNNFLWFVSILIKPAP